MSASATIGDSPLLRNYYTILTGGIEEYGEGQDLLPLLTDDFVFDGPIAGLVAGAGRFAQGVRGFIEAVSEISFLQAVVTDDSAAVLYDAVLPHGTVRFAEFFEFEAGRIKTLHIHYNAAEYVAVGGH
jgi:hypothetical protein